MFGEIGLSSEHRFTILHRAFHVFRVRVHVLHVSFEARLARRLELALFTIILGQRGLARVPPIEMSLHCTVEFKLFLALFTRPGFFLARALFLVLLDLVEAE